MAETTSATKALGAAGDLVLLSVAGMGGVSIQIADAFVGTVSFEASTNGQAFVALLVTPVGSSTQVSSATATGMWTANAVGMYAVRARMSAYTSGAATVTLRSAGASPGGSSGGGGGGGTSSNFGDAFPAAGTAAGFIGSTGNMTGATLDASGYIKVNVAAGGGGGGPVTIADGADVAEGALADAAVSTDASGSVSAKLRGLVKLSQALDLDTGAGTASTAGSYLALPASGGPVAGGTATNPIRTDPTGSTTQPVSGTVTANIGTSGALALEAGHLATIDTSTAASKVDLDTLVTATGSLTETAPATDTASSGLNGRLQRIAQRISSLITALGSPFQAGGSIGNTSFASTVANGDNAVEGITTGAAIVTDANGTIQQYLRGLVKLVVAKLTVIIDQTTPGTTNGVALTQIGSTTTVTGGVNGTLAVGGNVATNVAIGTNPVNTGGQGVSSENGAVTTGRLVQFVADLVGKQIVMPYANPENFVSGAITSAMTGTTSTSLVAAPAGSLRNYITNIVVSNSHATVGTDMVIQDGSGGTTLYTIPAAAVYGGASVTFPVPLRQPTTATAIYIANVTTGASTKASASGYKGL